MGFCKLNLIKKVPNKDRRHIIAMIALKEPCLPEVNNIICYMRKTWGYNWEYENVEQGKEVLLFDIKKTLFNYSHASANSLV